MKNRKLFAFMILLLIFPISLKASESSVPEKLTFSTILILDNNVPDSLRNDVIKIIQKHLKGEEFFAIVEDNIITDRITLENCIKKTCTAEMAETISDGIGLIISITSEDVKIGEKHISRYVVEDITEIRYTIDAAAVDLSKKRYDLVFSKTFNDSSKILKEADLIGIKIRDFYIKRKPVMKTDLEDGIDSFDYYDLTGFTFNISMMKPIGRLGDIADYGLGAEASINGIFKIIPFLTLNPGVSFYNMEPSNQNINSAYLILPEITCGYNFTLTDKITLTPLIGIGYSFMLIDGTIPADPGNTGSKLYYNPEFKTGIEASYILAQNYALLLNVSFHGIAEKSSLLYFSSFNFGLRMNLK